VATGSMTDINGATSGRFRGLLQKVGVEIAGMIVDNEAKQIAGRRGRGALAPACQSAQYIGCPIFLRSHTGLDTPHLKRHEATVSENLDSGDIVGRSGVDLNNLGPAYPKVLRKRYDFAGADAPAKLGRRLCRSGEGVSSSHLCQRHRSGPDQQRFQKSGRAV